MENIYLFFQTFSFGWFSKTLEVEQIDFSVVCIFNFSKLKAEIENASI